MIGTISILGSTGSIGTQTLDVSKKLGIQVKALTAMSNVSLLENQIREFKPDIACMTDTAAAKALKVKVADTDTKIVGGTDGLNSVAAETECGLLLNAVVGMAGLVPTINAIKSGKNIALANKETLVAGGKLVMDLAKEKGVKILPVDSEHSAIFQCIQGMHRKNNLKRVILTASGGPFFGKSYQELENVTKEQALCHPNWSMGAKITVDSATMMNKGLEFIEAVWLFQLAPSQVDIVIHRESIIHSLVEFVDNSCLAQLGLPDMRIPIQYAITYPDRVLSPAEKLDLAKCGTLSFFEPDYSTFKCLTAAKKAIARGGLCPAMVNGANEEAVRLFLNGQIGFNKIGELAEEIVENCKPVKSHKLEDVLNADQAAREFVINKCGNR